MTVTDPRQMNEAFAHAFNRLADPLYVGFSMA